MRDTTSKHRKVQHTLVSLALFISMAVTAVFTIAAVSAQSPQERDFFGTVVSAEGDLLVITTDAGVKEIPTSEDTNVRLPLKRNATLTDLVEGDFVAVSLEESDGVLVADKIFLIPGKTQYRHVPGEVTEVSDTQITLQPPGTGAKLIIFSWGPNTEVRYHRDQTELVVGGFVVIVAGRDTVTGELLPDALGTNVTARESVDNGDEVGGVVRESESANTVDIQGVFEGIDPDGNWVIGGRTVAVDSDTKIKTALAAGQLVKVEALVMPDGSVVAREVEAEEHGAKVTRKTRLEGAFEGVDAEGNWIVSGTTVTIGPGTDTDGLPSIGEPVKVTAFLRADGSLLAREIENKGRPERDEDDDREVKLEGTFQRIDEKGNWIIYGTRVAVGPLTRLEGTPAVGQWVEVKALLQEDGSLLASKVEGEEEDAPKSKSEAELRGTITEVLDDAIEIDGITVPLSVLTEIEGELQVGQFVKVEAVLQEDGSLLAREVESKGELGSAEAQEPSEVEIEGTIEKVNEDGTLVVNGITVAISALTEIKGTLAEGASVKLEGVMLQDGSILAGELKGEGRKATTSGTEVKIEGVIEAFQTDTQGRIISVTVGGLEVGIEALTEVEDTLEVGDRVEIQAIISDGAYLASKVESDTEEGEDEAREVKIEGTIEALQTDTAGRLVSVRINGVDVRVEDARVDGDLMVGGEVEIKGTLREGTIEASKIESEELELDEENERKRFELKGLIETVTRDTDGNITGVVVGGRTIVVDARTRIQGVVEVGSKMEIRGIIRGKTLVATMIESDEGQGERETGRGSTGERDEDRDEGDRAGISTTGNEEDDEDKHREELKFEGTIAGFSSTRLTLENGSSFLISSGTKIDGTLSVGTKVEVKAVMSNGALTATEINVEEREDSPESVSSVRPG